MAVKSKRESLKENINRNSTRSRVKYSNAHRIKSIKTVKKSADIKYVSKKLSTEHVKCTLYKNKGSSRIRTQTLIGNISSNAKDVMKGDNYNQPDTGVQAVLYVSDKIDTAVDVIYRSKRIIQAVRGVKSISDTVKRKSSIDKKTLIKQLSVKIAKSGLRTARNINTQVSNRFQSEDTDLGIRSFAEAEKEVRKTYDTVSTAKHTSTEISNVLKTASNNYAKNNEYFKNKIYSDRVKRYDRYKEQIQKSGKFNQKINPVVNTKKSKYHPSKIKTNNKILNKNIVNKSISKLSKNALEAVKRTVIFILPGKKTMLILSVVAAFVFLMVVSLSSGAISALSQQYFMADDDIAIKYKEKVEELDNELKSRIFSLEDDGSCDDVDVIYIGDNQDINTNFQEIFSLAAVKFEQDLTFSNKEEKFIEDIYSKLYEVKVSIKRYTVTDPNGKKEKKKRKIITVYAYDMETVMNKLNYDDEQKSWSRRLVSNFSEQFPEFAQEYGEISQEDISNLIANAPKFSCNKQKKLYETALSIVGKVKYFWGGKSSAGWNDNWGEPRLVTSPGNDTTGTYIPYGLDCSGYVDWVYKTAGISNMLSSGGTAYQWKQSYPVNRDELQVGDLAFMQMPNSSGINHVGIYIGKDKDGNNLYAHSEWGTGVTVNGFKGFKYFRRVVRFE